MKKILTYFVIVLGIFSIVSVSVKALPLESLDKEANNSLNLVKKDGSVNCDGILTKDAADLVDEVLNYIRIIAPILLILLTAVDFASAVFQQDNDAMKKATSKITKRLIAVVLLFFVPTIIRAIFNLKGVRDAIEIPDDPLCGTLSGNTIGK